MDYVPPRLCHPPNLAAPLTEVLSPNSSQVFADQWLYLITAFSLSFSPPSLSPSLLSFLPPFLSFLPFLFFCFHPTHDYKYTFLDQSSVTTHPFSFFLSKGKKKRFVALSLSEKEERKIEEGRSFHILESRNLVPFPQRPHDSSRKNSLL